MGVLVSKGRCLQFPTMSLEKSLEPNEVLEVWLIPHADGRALPVTVCERRMTVPEQAGVDDARFCRCLVHLMQALDALPLRFADEPVAVAQQGHGGAQKKTALGR